MDGVLVTGDVSKGAHIIIGESFGHLIPNDPKGRAEKLGFFKGLIKDKLGYLATPELVQKYLDLRQLPAGGVLRVMEVAPGMMGGIAPQLPDGATVIQEGGETFFQLDTVFFQMVETESGTAYEVIPAPDGSEIVDEG